MRVLIIACVFAAGVTSPVEKVVKVLQNMQTQLASEQKEDSTASEKMSCWCETNEKEKTAAVDLATKTIADLTAAIETGAAKSAELQTTLAKLAKAIAKNKEALASATALRSKENGEFTSEEAELTSSLASVSSAVDALAKHNSFLQTSSVDVTEGVRAALFRGADRLTLRQQDIAHEFLQQPAGYNSYNSRSGAIFGLLSQMKETFTTDLAQARADEKHAQSEFDALAAAKKSEIEAARKMSVDKTQELAQTDEDLANAKHDKELTTKALETDQAFLVDLEAKCTNAAAEYTERSKSRATEIAAVGDALKILTDDSARDLFSSTLSFVQTSQRQQSKQKAAAKLLQAAAARTGSKTLANMAEHAKLDAFTVVTGEIDKMVGALKKEMAAESEHRDFCNDEISKNEASQKATEDTLADLEAELESLDADIDTLKKEIKTLTEQSTEMKVQIKKASEDRESENQVFQQTVADQRATKALLTRALHRLEEVYADKEETTTTTPNPMAGGAGQYISLLQKQPAAPKYEKNENSGGVMGMLQGIIGDAERVESESVAAEQDAQAAYQSFVADTSKALNAATRSISKKEEELASKEAARVSAASSNKAKEVEFIGLKKYNSELHSSCDYVVKNYSIRQEARGQEIDALGQAKAILQGATFE
jgi:peptidoglycan hydrolase CwlO-like protein